MFRCARNDLPDGLSDPLEQGKSMRAADVSETCTIFSRHRDTLYLLVWDTSLLVSTQDVSHDEMGNLSQMRQKMTRALEVVKGMREVVLAIPTSPSPSPCLLSPSIYLLSASPPVNGCPLPQSK